jgi:hypothetical protein
VLSLSATLGGATMTSGALAPISFRAALPGNLPLKTRGGSLNRDEGNEGCIAPPVAISDNEVRRTTLSAIDYEVIQQSRHPYRANSAWHLRISGMACCGPDPKMPLLGRKVRSLRGHRKWQYSNDRDRLIRLGDNGLVIELDGGREQKVDDLLERFGATAPSDARLRVDTDLLAGA